MEVVQRKEDDCTGQLDIDCGDALCRTEYSVKADRIKLNNFLNDLKDVLYMRLGKVVFDC